MIVIIYFMEEINMRVLENCEPKKVFYYFEEICKIPHGSRNTKQISDYLVAFAKEHGFDYVQDEMNNVIIYKPATPGYENAPTVILQGHMDMVCEKRPDVQHDFEKDGLNLSVKDGYVTANGTTLGGDDGIAVAYALALLDRENTGLILNAVHSRDNCFLYLKEIVKGESFVELAEEEAEALDKAIFQEYTPETVEK